MKYETFFKDTFESISEYRKIVLQMFLIKNDVEILIESGCSKNDINRLNLEFNIILMQKI